MNAAGVDIWQAVAEAFVRLRGSKAAELWLGEARPAGLRRGLFTLDVPTPAAKAAIDACYLGDLQDLFREVTGSPVRVLTRVADAAEEAAAPPAPPPAAVPGDDLPERLLRPPEFVVTPANRLGARAVERFVLAPSAGWNPLFLYGPAGCGKTELARLALRRLREAGEGGDALVLSGPALMRDVSRAARQGTLPQLQEDWSRRDLLVLDEAHRLRGQRRSQAEAASLIAGMLQRGARVLVLSRHAPQQILDADPRLLSWFLGGMVVALSAPDTDDRRAVLSAVARALPLPAGEDVVEALASRCPGSLSDAVRVLQRAAHDAQAEAAAGGAAPVLDLQRLDRRLSGPTPAEATMDAIVATIATGSGVAPERIRSPEKSRHVVAARHLCAYLATRSLGLSARQVSRALGLASPSLVGYARRAVDGRRERDPAFDRQVHELQARLQGAQRDFAW
jgi:chromosomal replication initiator protein